MLLPLLSLLDVPPEHLSLVVDNAKSPAESVSLRKFLSRATSHAPTSQDNECGRWSNIPLPSVLDKSKTGRSLSPIITLCDEAHQKLSLPQCPLSADQSCATASSLRPPIRRKSREDIQNILSLANPGEDESRIHRLSLRKPIRKPSRETIGKERAAPFPPFSTLSSQMNFQWGSEDTICEKKPNLLLLGLQTQISTPHRRIVTSSGERRKTRQDVNSKDHSKKLATADLLDRALLEVEDYNTT